MPIRAKLLGVQSVGTLRVVACFRVSDWDPRMEALPQREVAERGKQVMER